MVSLTDGAVDGEQDLLTSRRSVVVHVQVLEMGL